MYKIIIDSCGEFIKRWKFNKIVEKIPLTITIDKNSFIDDENLNQKKLLKRMLKTHHCIHTSCPSPNMYLQAYNSSAKRIYVITVSSKQSGSYNSAILAKKLFYKNYKNKKQIHIFDSCSASIGETLIALKIENYENKHMKFKDIIKNINNYIKKQNTYFVLENIKTLLKNGRLNNIKSFITKTLNIKLIMKADEIGNIIKLNQAINMKQALLTMTKYIVKESYNCCDKILGIAHCNCLKRAKFVKDIILKEIKIKNVILLNTTGVSSIYTNNGGVIIVL